MFLSRQSRKTFGVAVSLFCLCSGLAKAQFFEETAVWKGTDSIGREVVLYVSPQGRFYSRYPLLSSATGDGHGVWSIDPTDSAIRFRSLSSEEADLPLDLISRRYTLARGQEEAVVLTAGDTGHQLTLRPLADSSSYFVELFASTEAGVTVLIQAHVNELEAGQLGLISFQMLEGG